ncbi:HAD ATPase, P-type, IC family protein [Paraburkholderia xenovorans LB400]|uniref:Divalent cation transporting (P-type) ATPase n=2 Tax=Paraburkholderia xenovorans TaxID=36873 RepID=Q13N90_PARXL|nr:Divalent cation transporting (P-type) ATPase [Paraburkholderia xenovorans LB400]AIP36646.1 HAD ATPase, P-type, IC family protein [Paraburkholderia xenovorans LB400]
MRRGPVRKLRWLEARAAASFSTNLNWFAMSSLPETSEHSVEDRQSGGLTSDEAQRRLQVFGPNGVPDTATSPWSRALGKLWAPVPWMLEAAIVLQLVLGEYVEAGVIAALLIFNAALGFFQESRAQATLDALKSRLALITPVRRDGAWKTVPVGQLVPGDIVKLSLGCIVGADVRLIEGEVLLDQSTLTGESLPIEGGPGLQTYAGALVRRGEAVAEVTATGAHTKFGQTAELVRIARVPSSQQQAVMRVVRNLAMFNGVIVLVQIGYASSLRMPLVEIVPLALTAILAAIPVALPATFTLATALGARVLAKLGVLPTRLSAIDEAASMDVLCADKTGTLTRNELAVTAVHAMPGFDEPHVLALAALASSEGGQDPVDAAIRNASRPACVADLPRLVRFVPFDPAEKMSEALATDKDDRTVRIVKGAFARVSALTQSSPEAAVAEQALEAKGFRVLAVGAGVPGKLQVAGLIALSDPPRDDSARLIADLLGMGVHTVMVTGDAVATAGVVAHTVGLDGAVCPPGPLPGQLRPEEFAVFAGVFPDDKFHIVKAFQSGGHIVGMCGDGANDAPALRQAQMGIAVSTATDVAKSAAGIVLTEPGLGGVVAAVREGRVTFQRILTYTLRSVTRKIDQMLFLTVGLIMTGHAVLTPMLMVVLMTTGDFLAMSSTTDNVRPSTRPNAWRINNLTIAGIVLASCNLLFCSSILALGKFWLHLGTGQLQTLAAVILVFSGQAVLYVVRERRRLWSSRPGRWLIVSSIADVSIIATLATRGILMSPLPLQWIGAMLGAAIVFAFVLDFVKVAAFARLKMV